ncbi:MAG: hypothetical protein R2991_13480 [Thermoanaerobaculia bacterium]
MKMILTLLLLVVGTVMLAIGGAAMVFTGGGGVAGSIRDLALAAPGGTAVWESPWLGVGGGVAAILVGFWLSRR